LGCAAALAVLDIIENESLCERATEVGSRLEESLRSLQVEYPDRIGDVRCMGAMVAMELVRDGDMRQPDPDLTKALSVGAAESGLILISCGVRGNVIRILAPLTIPFKQLEEGIGILHRTFTACV
jgi:4-aminobutyrate aminotransferase/(S)-3-amino-2-methylpropionate transaminase